MTRESLLGLTGFSRVGEGKRLRAYGLLFDFPTEATVPKEGCLQLTLTVGAVKNKAVRRAQKILREGEGLKNKVTLSPVNKSNSGAIAAAGVLGGAVDAAASADKSAAATFLLTIRFRDEMQIRQLYGQVLAHLEPALDQAGITAPGRCPLCGQPEGDSLTKFGERLQLFHRSCLQRWKESTVDRLESKKQNAGHFRGLIGGLLGGAAGSVPALVTLNIFDYFLGIFFAIIPLGTYFGWKLFGGRLNWLTTVFTIAYSLAVGLAVQLISTFLLLRNLFPGITLLDTIEAYLRPSPFQAYLLRDAGVSLLFAAVGIFIVWRMISRTDQQELDHAQAALEDAVSVQRVHR